MTTIAITGSASGIGAALCARMQADGHTVIGIDRAKAEVEADLSTPAGRAGAVKAVLARCDGVLDRLVCCAGVGISAPSEMIVAVNYFAASALADGLADALTKGRQPAAVIVSSLVAARPGVEQLPMVEAMLAGDEAKALELAAASQKEPHLAYAGSKYAIACFVRRKAVEWAKRGVRLNALAPGAVDTPLHQAALDHPRYGEATRNFIAPLGRDSRPDEQAAVIAFLLSEHASFIHGSVIFADGGMDAMVRPGRF